MSKMLGGQRLNRTINPLITPDVALYRMVSHGQEPRDIMQHQGISGDIRSYHAMGEEISAKIAKVGGGGP